MSRLDCHAVAELLAEHCERLFTELVPDAKQARNELRGHGPDGAIWAMVVRGAKRGVFASWGDQERQKGDCLELVHWAKFPAEQGRRDSYRWALRWLGYDVTLDAASRAAIAEAQVNAAEAAAWRAEQAEAERDRKATRSKGIYLHATVPYDQAPQIADYFRTRGIPIGELPSKPTNLRFGSKFYDNAHRDVPAMVAAIVHPVTRQHRATHCTYLQYQAGHWRNTELRPKRLTFGAKLGGVIPLLRGASGERRPPAGDTLLIGEGIENSLAAALCCPETPGIPPEPRVWAAVDIGNFSAIELPEEIYSVILVHDRDDEQFRGRSAGAAIGLSYRQQIARRWLEEGRSVMHMAPPKGFKDFNDYVAALIAARERPTAAA